MKILAFALYLLLSQDRTEAAVRKQELCSYSSYSDAMSPSRDHKLLLSSLEFLALTIPHYLLLVHSFINHFSVIQWKCIKCLQPELTTETKGKQRTIKCWTGIEREEPTLSSSIVLFHKFFYELLSGLSSTTFSVPHSQDTLLEVNCDEETEVTRLNVKKLKPEF